jgi:hypothetical protein
MTSCVQAEDGIEGGGGKLIWVVGVEEPCRGNELAGAPDLPGAEVNAGDGVAAGGEVAGERHATPAA